MLSCFKAIQYFQKSEWKKLEQLLIEDFKSAKCISDSEGLKRQLEEKEKELKAIKK
jgi:hypothetical protein